MVELGSVVVVVGSPGSVVVEDGSEVDELVLAEVVSVVVVDCAVVVVRPAVDVVELMMLVVVDRSEVEDVAAVVDVVELEPAAVVLTVVDDRRVVWLGRLRVVGAVVVSTDVSVELASESSTPTLLLPNRADVVDSPPDSDSRSTVVNERGSGSSASATRLG